MKAEWLKYALKMTVEPADFWSGCRKILTGRMFEFDGPLDDSLQINDCGFTKSKLTLLRKLYHDDDHAAAVAQLWARRVKQDKYGSISMSTYHHLTKSDPEKKSKRASVLGPCLLGVSATLMNDRSVAVDAFYRSTEWLKKFPADLIHIRDTVLPSLGISSMDVSRLRCHFANITVHVMYVATIIPLVEDPIEMFESFRVDPRFWKWATRWTSRYVLEEHEHGIAKFSQALRCQKDIRARLSPTVMVKLQRYLRRNHPGYDREKRE